MLTNFELQKMMLLQMSICSIVWICVIGVSWQFFLVSEGSCFVAKWRFTNLSLCFGLHIGFWWDQNTIIESKCSFFSYFNTAVGFVRQWESKAIFNKTQDILRGERSNVNCNQECKLKALVVITSQISKANTSPWFLKCVELK